jgi:hypothetical protein
MDNKKETDDSDIIYSAQGGRKGDVDDPGLKKKVKQVSRMINAIKPSSKTFLFQCPPTFVFYHACSELL